MQAPVTLLKFADLRPEWTLPGAQIPGTARAAYRPRAELAKGSARFILIPRGQSTPPHHTTSEHLIVMFQGTVLFEFETAGEYVLHQRDLLSFTSDLTYRYTNIGDSDALFLSVQTMNTSWPPETTYVESMQTGAPS
jgi:quercetin dioxygenase-like cupin family protein